MRLRDLALLLFCMAVVSPAVAGLSPEMEIWRLGLADNSNAEFGPGVNGKIQYSLPEGWAARKDWTGFPGSWTTAGETRFSLEITFPLAAAPQASYLELGVVDASSEGFACRVAINGLPLATQWVGGRQADNLASRSDLITHLYWAIPPSALQPGPNILTVWNPRENDGHNLPEGNHRTRLNLDYLRLAKGEKTVYKPMLRGAAMRWVSREAGAYGRSIKVGGGSGTDGGLYYGEGTFDEDVEILKLWRINYIYTAIPWAYLERGQDQWHQKTLADYEYQFKVLNSLGIKTSVALLFTPDWASSHPDAGQSEPKFEDYPSARLDDWVDFCRGVAEKLGKVVDNWLIGNEMELKEFFGGSKEEYLAMFKAARETICQYDKADADGDGLAAQVAPGGFSWQDGSSPADYPSFLEREAGALFESVHYHDYTWGNYERIKSLRRLFPRKELFLDEWGSGYWAEETKAAYEQMTGWSYPPAQPFSGEPLDEIRYLRFFQEPEVALDGYAVSMLKGDPNRNCSFDGQGGNYDNGNCWVDTEPGGKYLATEGGAYAQHFQWLYSYEGPIYPLAAEFPDDAEVLVDAVLTNHGLQVMATNFAAYGKPAVKATIRLPMAEGSYRVKFFDPYYPLREERLTAKDGWLILELTLGTPAQTRTTRLEITGA